MKHSRLLLVLVMAAIIYTAASQATASADSAGGTLFSTYCISCHNTVPTTDPRLVGASASKITNAIVTIPQMIGNSAIHSLTSAQIQSISGYITGAGLSTNWTMVGVGDFNKDGNIEILWRDMINGYNYLWLMNGTSVTGGVFLPTLADTNTWLVEGVGDFNNDGYADILWRNVSTGENMIWLMNGATVQSYVSLPTLSDRNWIVGAIGDFNGDGYQDILWRHLVNGYNAIWYLNGTSFSSADSLPALSDESWVIGGAADMDHDGHTDVLWRNKTAGYNLFWDLIGTNVGNYYLMTQVTDPGWTMIAATKPDSNGYVRIYWRNQNAGSTVIWTMNGATLVSSAALPTFGP
ncbi:MAG: VCBS repeat-containing protein [Nitrospirae bacterium]|nr:VCBS repeat-containing protein [Nitrospirota bacterium]